jgi:peroxiredoxin
VSELQGLQLSQDELRKRGASIAGVVVDPVEANAELAHTAGLEYPILSDPSMQMIDAYGLRHVAASPEGKDVAYSASVLIDRDGIVRWTSIARNFRVRPTPAEVLAAIDRLPPS